MRKKLKDSEKKKQVSFSINEEINKLLNKEVENTELKKSQVIEKILKEHFKNQ